VGVEVDKPRGSKITITVGDRGEDVVTIPPGGMSLPRLAPTLHYLFWLSVSGLLVLTVTFRLAHAAGEPVPAQAWLLLILGWWCWVAAALLVSVVWMLTMMFGAERLVFAGDELVQTVTLFGLGRTRRYPLKQVSRFESVPAWGFFRLWAILNECVMVLGRRRIAVAYRVTGEEAEWLAQQLNRLLERRRR
jgi:hypothetical protein